MQATFINIRTPTDIYRNYMVHIIQRTKKFSDAMLKQNLLKRILH